MWNVTSKLFKHSLFFSELVTSQGTNLSFLCHRGPVIHLWYEMTQTPRYTDGWRPATKVNRGKTCKYASRIKRGRKNSLSWWDVIAWIACKGRELNFSYLATTTCLSPQKNEAKELDIFISTSFLLAWVCLHVGTVYRCSTWRCTSLHGASRELPSEGKSEGMTQAIGCPVVLLP